MTTETAIDDRGIPDELATAMRRAFGIETAPGTLGEWAEMTAHVLDDADFEFGLEAMCTADESRHVAWIDGDPQTFHCVLDTLLVPFVVDESTVQVRSESPVSDATVELAVTTEDVSATPPEAVMSFGVASDVSIPTDRELDPQVGYTRFCPYVNAFPDETEYEQWARETRDATTMAVPMSTGFELAQRLARSEPFVTG